MWPQAPCLLGCNSVLTASFLSSPRRTWPLCPRRQMRCNNYKAESNENFLRTVVAVARAPSAFTLTDLMVVVATISLLSAILVIAGGAIRQKSRLACCTSNLQAINRAVLTFCADNAQTLPAPGPTDSGSI